MIHNIRHSLRPCLHEWPRLSPTPPHTVCGSGRHCGTSVPIYRYVTAHRWPVHLASLPAGPTSTVAARRPRSMLPTTPHRPRFKQNAHLWPLSTGGPGAHRSRVAIHGDRARDRGHGAPAQIRNSLHCEVPRRVHAHCEHTDQEHPSAMHNSKYFSSLRVWCHDAYLHRAPVSCS